MHASRVIAYLGYSPPKTLLNDFPQLKRGAIAQQRIVDVVQSEGCHLAHAQPLVNTERGVGPCCTDERHGRSDPNPIGVYAIRT